MKAAETAEAVRSKKVSAREAVSASLVAIEERDPGPHNLRQVEPAGGPALVGEVQTDI